MKIPATLPITGDQSRAARFQLGLTQANVIEESGLPGHKLKNFETGRFVPDMPFLENLRDFYTEKGVDLDARQPDTKPATGSAMVRPVSRMCFYVSDQIADDVVDQVLGRMDANDDRIAAILRSPVGIGFFSDYSEETEAKQRELFGAMAESYLLFRILQGRNIVAAPQEGRPAATHADLLSTFFAASPLAAVTNPVATPIDATTDQDQSEELTEDEA